MSIGLSDTNKSGFALPTVIIASVTMMIVLLAALQAVTSVNVAINEQYYQKLLSQAAESGSIYASHCIKSGQNANWSQLRAELDCNGADPKACTTAATDPCSVVRTDTYRTYFTVSAPQKSGQDTQVNITARLELLRKSSGDVYQTLEYSGRTGITQLRNIAYDRAAKRFWKVGANGSSLFDFGASGTSNPTITPQSAPSYTEGLTVVNDIDGNFLFSSNGINIWNRNNGAMSGDFGANNSTAQGVIAFPLSGGDRYLIVSNSATRDNNTDFGGFGELTTAVVDMNLSGGLGNVVSGSKKTYTRTMLNASSQNSPASPVVANPNGGSKYTTEFMTAAPEASGNGYWIIFGTQGTPYFFAVLFGNDGQFVKVVRSTTPTGAAIPICRFSSRYTVGVGMARFNSTYDKLAVASGTSNCQVDEGDIPSTYAPSSNKDRGKVYLLGFNATTGVLSGAFSDNASSEFAAPTVCMASGNTGAVENIAYSIDFSPQENYVYYTTLFPTDLYRYRITGNDVSAGTTTVPSTVQFLGHADNYAAGTNNSSSYPRGGQVRQAPNNKMYVANQYSTRISVINDPDGAMTQPACSGRASNFSYNTVVLGGSVTSGRGLPDYVTRYVPRTIQY